MQFLGERVFDPILNSADASEQLKKAVRLTITRMRGQSGAAKMIQYYWSAIVGTEKSVRVATMMRNEGFTRFEEVIDEFRSRFTDDWLRK